MAYSLAGVLSLKDKSFTSTLKQSATEAAKFDNKIKHLNNQVKKLETRFTGSFKNMAKAGAGFAAGYLGITGAAGLVGSAISGAADLEGYRNTLNVVMKDQKKAAETMAWAVNFANKTPFETDDIVQATVRLQSYGINAKEVMTSIGDMAGVMNKDIMQAAEAVADAQTGELERLKEFGITKQMIIDHANKTMRGKQVVNNKGQITDQKAFNKALFSLMEERFKGGMEIQANSFRGIMSTVTGVFKTSIAQMAGISATGEVKAGGLFDTIKQKAKLLADTLTRWAQDGTLERVGERITGVFNTLGSAIGWVRDNAGWLIPVVAGVTSAIMAQSIIDKISKAYKAWTAITKGLSTAQLVLNGIMAASPFGLVALAIGAVVAAGVVLYQNWDTIKQKALELWEKLENIGKKIKEFFGIKGQVNVGVSVTESYQDYPAAAVPAFAAGINRVPRDTLAYVHKDEAIIPAQYNPYNPNSKSMGAANIVININGYNKPTREIINEFVPQLKLALANM
ncbi:hypothetical protein BR63_19215 [Thermanaerosceptrum fracticalcis]|uniref:Cathelicidin antimicrobial peptide C-terminal domain-containing protein n=1 Tax=Thermanaerosceptrum fracticalcis TaxID=1712410 RepID=A0A7G6E808_THEFR|nr:hypothetical protein [Thermanaerosceptrum fracticalcis]QNB48212.1 hypothetical protein BR63_19215 [Thermanaerosceptrum fracticalcis]